MPRKACGPTQMLVLVCLGAQVGDVDSFSPALHTWTLICQEQTRPNDEVNALSPKPVPYKQVTWHTKTCDFPHSAHSVNINPS